jgi:hypothetical protein
LYFYRLDALLFSRCQLKSSSVQQAYSWPLSSLYVVLLYINAHFATGYQAIALARIVIPIIIILFPCFTAV